MTDDASLSDFLDAGDESADGDESGDRAPGQSDESADDAAPAEPAEDGREASSGASEASAPDPDPAVSACEWAAGGADCERCGESVGRRWRDDGAAVCADCKEW